MELVQKSTKNVQGRLFTHTRVHIWNLTFHQYSLSFKFNSGEKPRTFKLVHNQCITFKSPAMDHGTPCYSFHKSPQTKTYVSSVQSFYRYISQIQFQTTDIDEVVLIPKGKGKKYATSCIRSDTGRPAVGRRVICPLKYFQGEHGWCGTIPMNGNSETVARPTVDSGWGYCTDDCRSKNPF